MKRLKVSFRSVFLLGELGAILWRFRELAFAMARREISDRYAGQMLGTIWAIGHPIFLICIYLTVFVFVFQTKMGSARSGDYVLYILSGLIPWMTCQEAMIRGSTVITSHTSLVKQVAFPLEVLPVKSVFACLPNQLVCTLLLALYSLLVHGIPPVIWAFLPVLLSLQIAALIGLAYLLSVGGAFMRDLKDVLSVICTALLYCLPIFYRVEQLPEWARPFIRWNPFAHLLYCYQDIFIFQSIDHPWSWVGLVLSSFILLHVGYGVFRKSKTLFGDIL